MLVIDQRENQSHHVHCQGHWQVKGIKCSLEFHNRFVPETTD